MCNLCHKYGKSAGNKRGGLNEVRLRTCLATTCSVVFEPSDPSVSYVSTQQQLPPWDAWFALQERYE